MISIIVEGINGRIHYENELGYLKETTIEDEKNNGGKNDKENIHSKYNLRRRNRSRR